MSEYEVPSDETITKAAIMQAGRRAAVALERIANELREMNEREARREAQQRDASKAMDKFNDAIKFLEEKEE